MVRKTNAFSMKNGINYEISQQNKNDFFLSSNQTQNSVAKIGKLSSLRTKPANGKKTD